MELLEAHMKVVDSCMKRTQQRLVDVEDENIFQIYKAVHAVVLAMPDSECIKDLERNVRNVMVCYVLCTVGHTGRKLNLKGDWHDTCHVFRIFPLPRMT